MAIRAPDQLWEIQGKFWEDIPPLNLREQWERRPGFLFPCELPCASHSEGWTVLPSPFTYQAVFALKDDLEVSFSEPPGKHCFCD